MTTQPPVRPTAGPAKYAVFFALICAALYTCNGSGKHAPGSPPEWWAASNYWDTSTNVTLVRILVKTRIPGCSEVRWKPHPTLPTTVAAQCSRDGSAWVTYIVDTDRQTVLMP